MRRSRNLAAALAASLLLLSITACGDDGNDDAVDDTTTTTEPTDESTTTTEEDAEEPAEPDDTTTTVAEDGEGIGAIEELAASLLITLEELGNPTFTDAGYTPQDGPNLCGFDLDAEHPSDVLVGTTLGNDELVFQQEIRVYPSAEAAAAAFEAGIAGSSCGTAADGTVLGEPIDVTDEVGADAAVAINATNPDFEAVLIGALVSDALVSFQFNGLPGAADAAGAPNPVEVAAFGVGKILATLEEG